MPDVDHPTLWDIAPESEPEPLAVGAAVDVHPTGDVVDVVSPLLCAEDAAPGLLPWVVSVAHSDIQRFWCGPDVDGGCVWSSVAKAARWRTSLGAERALAKAVADGVCGPSGALAAPVRV